jgi:putative hydrolase of the HAD superfamily
MVKAVLFDLDDTLYDTTLQVAQARKNAVKAMVAAGLKATEDEAEAALKRVVSDKGPNYHRHYDDMLELMGQETDPKVVAAGIVAYHETKRAFLVPYPDTISTLLSLRERDYRIGVVTDGIHIKQWEKLIRLGLADFFHTVVVAGDKMSGKPSPEPFLKAAENLEVEPGECIVVGDRLDRDILGAKKAGMKAVQLARGKHASKKPTSSDEEPDYVITRLNDLALVLGKGG